METKRIYHTITTSRRHKEIGYCEQSDFGSIELWVQDPGRKELIVSFRKYEKDPIEYVNFDNYVYRKISGIPGMSRDEEAKEMLNQGKYTSAKSIKLMLTIRANQENHFSNVQNLKFLLIGRTLYEKYCKHEELGITVCGNLSFSYWLSIDIETHFGKEISPFSKATYYKILKEKRKLFESNKPKPGERKGDGHVYFGHPTHIKWGKEWVIKN